MSTVAPGARQHALEVLYCLGFRRLQASRIHVDKLTHNMGWALLPYLRGERGAPVKASIINSPHNGRVPDRRRVAKRETALKQVWEEADECFDADIRLRQEVKKRLSAACGGRWRFAEKVEGHEIDVAKLLKVLRPLLEEGVGYTLAAQDSHYTWYSLKPLSDSRGAGSPSPTDWEPQPFDQYICGVDDPAL